MIDGDNINDIFNVLNIEKGDIIKLNQAIYSKEFTCKTFEKDEIYSYMSFNICIYLVINNKIIGICCIILNKQVINISFLCAPPVNNNRGNGIKLLNKIKELSSKIGYNIELYSMPNVVMYYKRNGFEIVDPEINEFSKNHYVNEEYFDEFGIIHMIYKTPSPPISSKSPTPTRTSKSPTPPISSKSPTPPISSKSPTPPRTSKSPSPPRTSKSPSPPRTSKSPSPPRTLKILPPPPTSSKKKAYNRRKTIKKI